LHTSARRLRISQFQFPAMSPTMTEGGIAAWKIKEGDHFSAGDLLLEIETDKATMDVEAQDDGVLGKILVPNGSKGVPVGKVIALFAEDGDDISNLEVPAETAAAAPEPKPEPQAAPAPAPSSPPAAAQPLHNHPYEIQTTHPLFPSVMRLLEENKIHDASQIKGTGVRGMLTKGDVLSYLGKASTPFGTFEKAAQAEGPQKPSAPKPAASDATEAKQVKSEVKPLDALGLRALMAQGLANLSKPPPPPPHREPSTA
ncbi:single hybrid motif-containing protein, partial [Dacryopinax primogenitus]